MAILFTTSHRLIWRAKLRAILFIVFTLGVVGIGFVTQTHTAGADMRSYTYDFEGDTIGESSVDISPSVGANVVVDGTTYGLSSQVLETTTDDTTDPAISMHISDFMNVQKSRGYQQLSWQHAYSADVKSGFILRSQDSAAGIDRTWGLVSQGYYFEVDTYNDQLTIYRLDDSDNPIVLDSFELTAPGVNTPRWYRATADGDALTAEWSANGVDWTTLGSTNDDTYTSGRIQLIQGFSTPPGAAQVIDNLQYSLDEVGMPSAVQDLVAEDLNNGTIKLTWAAPADDGGLPILTYQVHYKQSADFSWNYVGATSGDNMTFGHLINGTPYDFKVEALNEIAVGWPATASATPGAPPAQPTNLIATPGDEEVQLSWSAPNNVNGFPVTDYRIQYKTAGGEVWATFDDGVSTDTNAVVTGLTNGVEYNFHVAAINSRGTGADSAIQTAVPAALPAAPTGLTATALDDGTVELKWVASPDGDAVVTDYIIEYKLATDSSWTIFSDGVSIDPLVIVTGLTLDVAYDFRVSAKNSIGVGESSGSVSATPQVPAEPEPAPDPDPTPPVQQTPPTNTSTSTNPTTGGSKQATSSQLQASINYGDKILEDDTSIEQKPTFTGTATSYAIVVVTVYSDPVTCTTTADGDGHWSCTLSTSLPAGKHTVYVSVTSADGQSKTELGPYTVVVQEDDQPVTVTDTTNTDVTKDDSETGGTGSSLLNLWPYALGIVILVVITVLVVRRRH